jgi:hypothetical protein
MKEQIAVERQLSEAISPLTVERQFIIIHHSSFK